MIFWILDTVFLGYKICICFAFRVYIIFLSFSIYSLIESIFFFSSLSIVIIVALQSQSYYFVCVTNSAIWTILGLVSIDCFSSQNWSCFHIPSYVDNFLLYARYLECSIVRDSGFCFVSLKNIHFFVYQLVSLVELHLQIQSPLKVINWNFGSILLVLSRLLGIYSVVLIFWGCFNKLPHPW